MPERDQLGDPGDREEERIIAKEQDGVSGLEGDEHTAEREKRPGEGGKARELSRQEEQEDEGVESDLDRKRPVDTIDPWARRPEDHGVSIVADKLLSDRLAGDEAGDERDAGADPGGGKEAQGAAAQERHG